MCGICGIACFSGTAPSGAARASVDAMVEALAHRGPDGSGVAASAGAILGATRLAIRGLEGGSQPIVDRASGVVMVCNGEIDNHGELRRWLAARGRRVELETDVAVIPPLYLELGEEFVDLLVGVFAIGLWDPRSQTLLLARDRAGERSLFCDIARPVVRFASELCALALDPGRRLHPARDALPGYLETGCFVAPASPFAEIRKLAPAEVLKIDANGIAQRRYWSWRPGGAAQHAPSLEDFDAVFREAVRRQSDVDVPYGVFLSGGLDSSLVAAVARELQPERPLRAYTIRFEEDSYDEGRQAERIAGALGLEPVSVLATPEVFPEELARLVRRVGEPVADQSWIATALLARRAAKDVKLALVGEGADELFGGYPTYLGACAGAHYGRVPAPLRTAFARAVEAWPSSDKKVTLSFLLKRFVQGWHLDGVSRHRLWTANLSPALLGRLGAAEAAFPAAERRHAHLLDAVQTHDFETRLAEGLLTEKDRGSMSAALELRSPFLDRAVMEFAAALPVAERARGLATKVFLKRYASRYLPAWVVRRRKRGLSVPLSGWLRGPLRDWAAARLGAGHLDEVGIRSRAALHVLEEHGTGRVDHARALWTLLVLAEWLEWAAECAAAGRRSRAS